MPRFNFRLRIILFFVNLSDISRRPLEKTRGLTYFFMRLMSLIGGFKFPRFYSVRDVAFTSTEGHPIKLKVLRRLKQIHHCPFGFTYMVAALHMAVMTRPDFCKTIATRANCIVVSVQYRLAPEHPFPAGPNDCYEAALWVSKHMNELGGNGKLAVGGESAGGNLSAVLAQMARDKGEPRIVHQTLLYPCVDATFNYPSVDENAKGYMLTKALMQRFHKAYVPDEKDHLNPYVSPVYGNLKNLPPATLLTAEFDPLRDEGNLYAEKLKEAGVPVLHKEFKNTIHDFTMILSRRLPEARESIDIIVNEVKKAFET